MESVELSQAERDLLLDLLIQSSEIENNLRKKLSSLTFNQPVSHSTGDSEHQIGDRVIINGSANIPPWNLGFCDRFLSWWFCGG